MKMDEEGLEQALWRILEIAKNIPNGDDIAAIASAAVGYSREQFQGFLDQHEHFYIVPTYYTESGDLVKSLYHAWQYNDRNGAVALCKEAAEALSAKNGTPLPPMFE